MSTQTKLAPASGEETRVSKNRLHGLWALTNRDLRNGTRTPSSS
jgi:hypothetical protein